MHDVVVSVLLSLPLSVPSFSCWLGSCPWATDTETMNVCTCINFGIMPHTSSSLLFGGHTWTLFWWIHAGWASGRASCTHSWEKRNKQMTIPFHTISKWVFPSICTWISFRRQNNANRPVVHEWLANCYQETDSQTILWLVPGVSLTLKASWSAASTEECHNPRHASHWQCSSDWPRLPLWRMWWPVPTFQHGPSSCQHPINSHHIITATPTTHTPLTHTDLFCECN